MKSQTSLIASQCRLQQWAKQIRDCQNRPADMQVAEWCEMNGITTACVESGRPVSRNIRTRSQHLLNCLLHRSLILYPPVRSPVRSSSVKMV